MYLTSDQTHVAESFQPSEVLLSSSSSTAFVLPGLCAAEFSLCY